MIVRLSICIRLSGNKIFVKIIKIIIISSIVWLFLCDFGDAYDVLFIGNAVYDTALIEDVKYASQLYGITTKYVLIKTKDETEKLSSVINETNPHAIIVSAITINEMGIEKRVTELINKKIKNEKVLISNILPGCNPDILLNLSQGKLFGCKLHEASADSAFYQISNVENITRELSDQRIPAKKSENIFYFLNDKRNETQSIINLNTHQVSNLPVFIKMTAGTNELFFSTKIGESSSNRDYRSTMGSEKFINIMPLLMFLRYSLGEKCWHSSDDFANFTIDDPWLIEPYGNLRFNSLLLEMEKVNFHTTIAFIPWNYDRNKKEVVDVFLNNPSRFSICIHGNNHDHREFYEYEKKQGAIWQDKTLAAQEFYIRQALARMEKFSSLTGIPYERIMIFPHDISPANTLELLKKYNFMATINSPNVPLNAPKSEDPLFSIRPISMHYNTFASIKRHGPHRKANDIAVDLFLDNPVFFFAHQNFFGPGIDRFNETARTTNTIQPKVKWQSVGNILQHYYLEKLRGDGNYDIEVYSNDFVIKNNHTRNLKYYVFKKETFSLPIRKVLINGTLQSYTASNDRIQMVIPLKKGESKHVNIEYTNYFDTTSIEIERTGIRIYLLRMFSDFRDIYLSKTFLGRKFVDFYYESKLYEFGLILAIPALLLVLIAIYMIYRLLKRQQKKN